MRCSGACGRVQGGQLPPSGQPVQGDALGDAIRRRVSDGRGSAFATEFRCSEANHVRRRVSDVPDHDFEVHLLGDGRVRPGRRTMVGSKLEREPRGSVVGRDDHEIVAVVRDRPVEECGVEPREPCWVRAVEDDVMQTSAHFSMVSANDRSCGDPTVNAGPHLAHGGAPRGTAIPVRSDLFRAKHSSRAQAGPAGHHLVPRCRGGPLTTGFIAKQLVNQPREVVSRCSGTGRQQHGPGRPPPCRRAGAHL